MLKAADFRRGLGVPSTVGNKKVKTRGLALLRVRKVYNYKVKQKRKNSQAPSRFAPSSKALDTRGINEASNFNRRIGVHFSAENTSFAIIQSHSNRELAQKANSCNMSSSTHGLWKMYTDELAIVHWNECIGLESCV